MIHIVARSNRDLYQDQLRQLLRDRWPALHGLAGLADPDGDGVPPGPAEQRDAVYLIALAADGRVEAGLRLRPAPAGSHLLQRFPQPAGPGGRAPAWEASRLLLAPADAGDRLRLRRRALEVELAAAEHVLASGGRRLVTVMALDEVPAWLDLVVGGVPRIHGPREDDASSVGLVAACLELDPAAVRAGREMLGEPAEMRLAYEIDHDDLKAFADLLAAERAVDEARRFRPDAESPDCAVRADGAAQASALYARHDAAVARGVWLDGRWPGALWSPVERPHLLH